MKPANPKKHVPARAVRFSNITRMRLCLDLMFSGMKQVEIARKYGMSEAMVSKYKKSLGLTHLRKTLFSETAQKQKKAKFEL